VVREGDVCDVIACCSMSDVSFSGDSGICESVLAWMGGLILGEEVSRARLLSSWDARLTPVALVCLLSGR
jgi:hypothetical protein